MFPRGKAAEEEKGHGRVDTEEFIDDFASKIEPTIRSVIRDEVNTIIRQASGPTLEPLALGVPAEGLILQFMDKIPSTIFTGSKIETEDGSPVRIQLLNASSNTVVKSGPFSSLKVEITVLDGDFVSEDWSDRDFSRNVIRQRDGKRPLVTGELIIVLSDGVGQLGDLAFTDNSSWVRCRRFRLGAKPVLKRTSGEVIRIREGRSDPFAVKDHRGEGYQKHYPPRLGDEVWRLEKVAKGGKLHNRLSSFGINTVKELLQANAVDQPALRNKVVGGVISNRVWDMIMVHANACEVEENKFYAYGKHGEGIRLLFDPLYKLVGASFDDEKSYIPLDKLTNAQKILVELFRGQEAIHDRMEMVPVDSSSVAFTSFLPLEEVDHQRKYVPSFVSKTYQLVDDPSTDHIVSWVGDGSTFLVRVPAEFARDVLPKYFKHNNFSSFVRQLNTFGFRKFAPERWEFVNEFFKKGEEHLLCQIKRRKTQTFLKKDESKPSPDLKDNNSISSQSSCLYNDSGITNRKWKQETSAVTYSGSCASEVTTWGQEIPPFLTLCTEEEVASHVPNWLSLPKPESNLKAKSAWRKLRTALKFTSILTRRTRLIEAAKVDFRLLSFQRMLKEQGNVKLSSISDEQAFSFIKVKGNMKPSWLVEAAAARIQNKFRSWKARMEFLAILHKIVKIQAHVRGHHVRKNIKVILSSVGITKKVVLRRRRNRSMLRGFRPGLVDESHRGSIQQHLSAGEDEQALPLIKVKGNKKLAEPVEAAAVRIQRMFRSWKARKEFLVILQKVVKIQAHVRGHHARKNFMVMSSSLSIVEKVVLRWKRNRSTLHGFRPELVDENHHSSIQPDLSAREDDYGFFKEERKQTEERSQIALVKATSVIQLSEPKVEITQMKDLKFDMAKALQLQSFTSKQNLHSRNSMFTQEIYISKYPSFQISAHNFVSLVFPYCNFPQLWKGGEQLLVNLKSMDLNHSNLFEIPNLSKAQKLESVNLEGCGNLVGVPSIQYLTNLKNLNLKGCHGLKGLPSLIRLKFLNSLDLSDCSSLTRLPPSLGCLPNLCELNLRNCTKLDYLPRTVLHLMRSLETLNVSGCYSLWKPINGDLVSNSTEGTCLESQSVKPVEFDAAGDSPSQDLSPEFNEMHGKEALEWELDDYTSTATPLIDYLPSKLRTRLLLHPAMDFEDKNDHGDTTRTVSVSCQVEDCGVDLSQAETYHQRHRICEVHYQASNALVRDVLQRFCLQCCRFHILEDFDDGERNCRSRLAGYHQKQRRQSIATEDEKPSTLETDENGSLYKRTKWEDWDEEANDAFGSIENDVLEMVEQLSSWNCDGKEVPEDVVAWLAELEQSVPETVMSMKSAKAEAGVVGEKLKEMDARLVVGRVELSLLDKEMSRILKEEEEIEAQLQLLMDEKNRRDLLMQQKGTEP